MKTVYDQWLINGTRLYGIQVVTVLPREHHVVVCFGESCLTQLNTLTKGIYNTDYEAINYADWLYHSKRNIGYSMTEARKKSKPINARIEKLVKANSIRSGAAADVIQAEACEYRQISI